MQIRKAKQDTREKWHNRCGRVLFLILEGFSQSCTLQSSKAVMFESLYCSY